MKSLTSAESETPNDSTLPPNVRNSLCFWVDNPVTQHLLTHLQEQADQLTKVVLDLAPGSRKEEVIREQSVGHIRGLVYPAKYIQALVDELAEQQTNEQAQKPSDSQPNNP